MNTVTIAPMSQTRTQGQLSSSASFLLLASITVTFLAGAAAPGDQNRRLSVGDFPDQFQDVTNRFALAYNVAQLKFHHAAARAWCR